MLLVPETCPKLSGNYLLYTGSVGFRHPQHVQASGEKYI